MSTDPATLITAYIEAVGNKQFDRLPAMFQPDIALGGPNIKPTTGIADYVAALVRLGPILERNEIKQLIVTGDEVCVFYDFVTNTPAGAVATAEWLTLRDGRIQSSRLIFDRRRWPEVLQALGVPAPAPAAN